jgi:hypothetical protein
MTGKMENMDICFDDRAQMVTPKRNGTTVSLSGDAPGQHKRLDHKPSPKKKDFCKDE